MKTAQHCIPATFFDHFFCGVFGPARRYLDWFNFYFLFCCVEVSSVVLCLLCCVALCCNPLCCVVLRSVVSLSCCTCWVALRCVALWSVALWSVVLRCLVRCCVVDKFSISMLKLYITCSRHTQPTSLTGRQSLYQRTRQTQPPLPDR